MRGLDDLGEDAGRRSPGTAPSSSPRARAPSSVWVGGIRTSTTATSGRRPHCDRRGARRRWRTDRLPRSPPSAGSAPGLRGSSAESSAITTRTGSPSHACRLPAGSRSAGGRPEPLPGRPGRVRPDPAVRRRAADAVVRDLDHEASALAAGADRGRRGVRVLRARSSGPRRRRSRRSTRSRAGGDRGFASHLDRGPAPPVRVARQSDREATLREDSRVNATGQLAELLDGNLHLVGSCGEQRARRPGLRPDRRGCRWALFRSSAERDQPLLRAVVEIALDSAALLVVRRATMRDTRLR